MKRLLIALAILGLSTSAFADSTVLVPSQKGGLKVGIDALYLRPGNSNLDYASNITFPARFIEGYEQNKLVDPTYDWGFYAQVGYLFPCTGNDLTLGYTYLNANASDASELGTSRNSRPVLSVLPVNQLLDDEGFPGVDNSIATSNVSFDLNAVDLEGGQRFTTGAFDIRMFAGVRYARVAQKLATDIPDGFADAIEPGGPFYNSQSFSSAFRGIGPRIGADGRYCLSSGFGLDAHLGASLLVGNISSNYTNEFFITSEEEELLDSAFEVKNCNTNRLVPNIDAKLGVDYTYAIPGCHKSAIVFEAGYQTSNYFNVSDQSPVVDPSGTSFISQNSTNNISFDGIYLGVKYYA